MFLKHGFAWNKAETDTKNILIQVHRKSSFSYQFREHQPYLVSSQISPTAVSDWNILFQLSLIFPHQQWLVSNSQCNTEHPPKQNWLSLVTSPVISLQQWTLRRNNFNTNLIYTAYLNSESLTVSRKLILILTSCCKTTSRSLKVMCAADTSSNTTLPQKSCLTYHNRQLPTKQFRQKYFSVHPTIGSHY